MSYIEFVKETMPVIQNKFTEIGDRIEYFVCPRCRYSGFTINPNQCPKCKFNSDDY